MSLISYALKENKMIYLLKETEISLLKNFEKNIDELYSNGTAQQLRKLIFFAVSHGYIYKNDIKRILKLLPLVITKVKFEEKKSINCSSMAYSAEEYANIQYEHYMNTIKRLQYVLSNLFLENVIQHSSFRRRNKNIFSNSQTR